MDADGREEEEEGDLNSILDSSTRSDDGEDGASTIRPLGTEEGAEEAHAALPTRARPSLVVRWKEFALCLTVAGLVQLYARRSAPAAGGGPESDVFRWSVAHLASHTTFVSYHFHREAFVRTEAWQGGELLYVLWNDGASFHLRFGATCATQWSDPALHPVDWHDMQWGSAFAVLEDHAAVHLPKGALRPPAECQARAPAEPCGSAPPHNHSLQWRAELELAAARHLAIWQQPLNTSLVEAVYFAQSFNVRTQRVYAVPNAPLADLPERPGELFWRNCSLILPFAESSCRSVQACAQRETACGGRPLCACFQTALAQTLLPEHERRRCSPCTLSTEQKGCGCWSQWLLVRAMFARQPCAQRMLCPGPSLPVLCPGKGVCLVQPLLPCYVTMDGTGSPAALEEIWLV